MYYSSFRQRVLVTWRRRCAGPRALGTAGKGAEGGRPGEGAGGLKNDEGENKGDKSASGSPASSDEARAAAAEKQAISLNIHNQLDQLQTGVTKQSKVVTKHFSGVPRQLKHILGKIESISCGDQNSFAIVKV